ncbi:MAG: hypothetical protein ACK40R_00200 [Thermomonas sp.]
MEDIYGIRRANLMSLISDIKARRPGAREQDIAAELDLGASHYSQIKSGKVIGDDVARKIETAMGLEYGWLDNPSYRYAPTEERFGSEPQYVVRERDETGYYSRSHSLRIDPDTISAALKLVRLAFLNRDEVIDQEINGEPLAYAYEFLMQRKEHAVTPENVIDFTRLLKRREQGDMDATQTRDDRSTGAGRRSHQ